jgi:hypothetical protein
VYGTLTHYNLFGAILTGKTWLADDDPTGQNDRQLTLHTLMHFVGALQYSPNAQ